MEKEDEEDEDEEDEEEDDEEDDDDDEVMRKNGLCKYDPRIESEFARNRNLIRV
jgi:TATA-binding protein-associated factor Taf7